LTQAIRNFAKNLENWLTSAMSGCPDKIVQIKLQTVSAFSQTLRRYTSLNHLAQAARAVLQNSSQIAQMLNDLNRVDFHNVQVKMKIENLVHVLGNHNLNSNRNKHLGCASANR
jgi:regulatory factor X 1/2/3